MHKRGQQSLELSQKRSPRIKIAKLTTVERVLGKVVIQNGLVSPQAFNVTLDERLTEEWNVAFEYAEGSGHHTGLRITLVANFFRGKSIAEPSDRYLKGSSRGKRL
jgi:hypothetical protein